MTGRIYAPKSIQRLGLRAPYEIRCDLYTTTIKTCHLVVQ